MQTAIGFGRFGPLVLCAIHSAELITSRAARPQREDDRY
jgi:hypothetical protein